MYSDLKPGDNVVIEHRFRREQQTAEVETVFPKGGFSVHWYAVTNTYASNLPVHFAAHFHYDGANMHGDCEWRIIGRQ